MKKRNAQRTQPLERRATRTLAQAANAVAGPRNADYGPPSEDFACQADMMSAYLSRRNGIPVRVTAGDIAALMCLVKLGRQAHQPKPDNWVDIAGYAACGSEVNEVMGDYPTATKEGGHK